LAARSPAYGDATSSLKIVLLLRLSTVARESWRPGSPSDNRKRWRGLSSISVAAGGPRAEGRPQRPAAGRAKGDPAAFRSILERALATSPTPWALLIQRLPADLATWDLEDYPGVRDLLCEIGHQGSLSRDAHLRLLAERYGVALATLQEAARELAQSADAEA
jgi:hypothetical protein